MIPPSPIPGAGRPVQAPRQRDDADLALRAQAQALEALLFQEMMRVSEDGRSAGGLMGGGSQFDSFLREARAQAVANSGTTGLAESIYRALADRLG